MKAEPLKGKLKWTVSKNILRNLLHAEIDSHITFMKKDDICSAVDWLKLELVKTHPDMLSAPAIRWIHNKIEKAFEDVVGSEK